MQWPSGHALSNCSVTEFALWRQQTRGALSLLPTVSGPWIWEPPAEIQEPEQMSMFENVGNRAGVA